MMVARALRAPWIVAALSWCAAGCPAPDFGELDASPSPVRPDARVPDATAPMDAGLQDAGLQDAAPFDAGPLTRRFLEDFLDQEGVDTTTTSATIDTTPPGFARGTSMSMPSTGDGSDGRFAPTEDVTLEAGEHQFTEIDIDTQVSAQGDLIIRSQGNLRVGGSGRLFVTGSLTLIAGGRVEIAGSVESTLDLIVHHPATSSVTVGGLLETTSFSDIPDQSRGTGSITVNTRGAFHVTSRARVRTGPAAGTTATGALTIRAYGDVTVRDSAFVQPGRSEANTGGLTVMTEGDVVVDGAAFLGASAESSSRTEIRAAGDVRVLNGAFLRSGADLDLVAQGGVTLDQRGSVRNGVIGTRTGTISITSSGLVIDNNSAVRARISAPNVVIRVAGDARIGAGSTIEGSSLSCAPGGAVRVETTGDIQVQGTIRGGESRGTSTCGPAAGGRVTVLSGGSIQPRDGSGVIVGGQGATPGERTVRANAMVEVPPVDAGLLARLYVRSQPLEVDGAGVVLTLEPNWMIDSGTSGVVRISPTGALDAFTDRPEGQTLDTGWRYEAHLTARMFDTAALDRITVTYR